MCIPCFIYISAHGAISTIYWFFTALDGDEPGLDHTIFQALGICFLLIDPSPSDLRDRPPGAGYHGIFPWDFSQQGMDILDFLWIKPEWIIIGWYRRASPTEHESPPDLSVGCDCLGKSSCRSCAKAAKQHGIGFHSLVLTQKMETHSQGDTMFQFSVSPCHQKTKNIAKQKHQLQNAGFRSGSNESHHDRTIGPSPRAPAQLGRPAECTVHFRTFFAPPAPLGLVQRLPGSHLQEPGGSKGSFMQATKKVSTKAYGYNTI